MNRISPLLTDEYCFTMAQSFWRHDQDDMVTFEMFVRRLPVDYGFAVFCGLENVITYLEQLRFTDEDLEFMATQLQDDERPEFGRLYDEKFLGHLRNFRFTGELYAMREGDIFFPGEPVLRVTARRIEATIIEPMLLKMINRQSSVATKSARIIDYAGGRPIFDFSLRRDPGDPFETARAAYIGGMVKTAVPAVYKQLGIRSSGTMAHQYIQMFGEDREQQGYEQWLLDYPGRAVLLVDTYNTRRGIDRAIAASLNVDVPIKAVRLDSGDLIADCIWARRRLDDAGMHDTMIMPTGDLDEHKLQEMLAAGAPFDLSAAGTKVANAAHFGGVYKLTEQDVTVELRYVMKKATGKVSDPGSHQVWRGADGDTISLLPELIEGARPLLRRWVAAGGRLAAPEPLDDIRDRVRANIEALPGDVRAISEPAAWPVVRSDKLLALRDQLGDETAYGAPVPA
jgi:nicotinate phosphoribosyltransferase